MNIKENNTFRDLEINLALMHAKSVQLCTLTLELLINSGNAFITIVEIFISLCFCTDCIFYLNQLEQ